MFKISWDKETGGILLGNRVTDETLGISPRPVFHEELDLIGLDRLGWRYPKCQEPLLWAQNKRYFYRGEFVFEAKGANIYDAPTVVFAPGMESLSLQPVDVTEMLRRNADMMFLLESEAIEFIRDVFVSYSSASRSVERVKANQMDFEAMRERIERKTKRKMAIVREDCDSFDIMPLETARAEGRRVYQGTKVDRFIASFSGGKDSQVILDLCTRAIPSADFEVFYSDTGYELPSSLELYEETKRHYGERFPNLKFHITRNHESVLNYWDKIGTPSDTHRWCCTVMKTAPLYRALKLPNSNKQAKVLAFEGVRAEESTRRSGYHRIGKGVKHSFVINARPILAWSTTEVFLYLFSHSLAINEAYRLGKPRVGCILCPFGSPWDDMIVSHRYEQELKPFRTRLERVIKERDIPNGEEYLSERLWKLRGSGKYSQSTAKVSIVSDVNKLEACVCNSTCEPTTWMATLGHYTYNREANEVNGEIPFANHVYKYNVVFDEDECNYTFKVYDDCNIRLRYLLRRILYKDAYCINCESCEIECPTGALSTYPKIAIDTTKCISCFKCLEFHSTGCVVADSLVAPINNNMKEGKEKNPSGASRYGSFGIHSDWIKHYLSNPDEFWGDNSLGTKQITSFKAWLRDAEFVDDKYAISPLGGLCKKLNDKGRSELVWEIIVINLAYNSALFCWYNSTIDFNRAYTAEMFLELAYAKFDPNRETTVVNKNLKSSLLQCFKYSVIGEKLRQGVLADTRKNFEKGNTLMREAYEDLSVEAVAYSIYKYAQAKGISFMRVSDFYRPEETSGPYREFGISESELKKKLRALSSGDNRVLIAELNMGLDHITLREDLTPVSALEALTK